MSNTLKLGNGKWATGKDTLLSFSDTNNNYKPLPFSFSRASSGTVVNKDGLIETVGSGEPRIDFKDNTKGALLLEPQRTNSLLQSNQFDTTWTTTNAIITSGQIGVGGSSDAWLLSKSSIGGRINQSISLNGVQTTSIYAKADTSNWIAFISGGSKTAYFDLKNGVLGTISGTAIDAKIESVGNGWYRCSLTQDVTLTQIRVYVAEDDLDVNGTSGSIYIQNAQVEQGSYATSYIPTSGSAVSRSLSNMFSDDLNNLGLINDTEGVFYTEIKMPISSTRDISAGGLVFGNTSVWAGSRAFEISKDADGSFRIAKRDSGFSVLADIVEGVYYKIAFKWDSLNVYLYVNGSLVTTSTYTQTDFKYIFTDNRDSQKFIKEIKLYNTALTDQELIALTQ